MNKSLLAILLLALLGLSFLGNLPVRAQDASDDAEEELKASDETNAKADKQEAGDETEPDDEDEDLLLIPHPDVTVSAVFPDSLEKKFALGEAITVLLGFNNKGDQAFNITGIGAHLQSPHDLSYYIQNFTARRVMGAAVGPRQQAAAEYVFLPDPTLEPLEFWMSAWVIYNNSADQVFMHTFYNSTIELYEPNTGFSARALLSWLLTAAFVGIVGYIVIRVSGAQKPKKKKSVERGTTESSADSSVPVYTPAKESRRFGSKKGTKAQ